MVSFCTRVPAEMNVIEDDMITVPIIIIQVHLEVRMTLKTAAGEYLLLT